MNNRLDKKCLLTTLLLVFFACGAASAASVDYELLAENGSKQEISKELRSSDSLYKNVFGDERQTFLMMLLINDRPYDIIETAVKGGCEISSKDKNGRTVLMYAAQYTSDSKIIDYIVSKSALSKGGKAKKILAEDKDKKTAFDYSLMNQRNKSIYSVLGTYAKDPYAESRDFASLYGYVSSSEQAADSTASEAPKEVEETVSADRTEVEPVTEKNEEIVETKNKPNNEAAEIIEKKAPEVSTYTQTYIYDYILNSASSLEDAKKEADVVINDPDATDANGMTRLMKACKSGNDWEVERLIKSGADINIRDKDGWSALMYAVRYQNSEIIVQQLIDGGAHVRVRNNFNSTPLIMAAQYSSNPDILKLMLKNRTISENEVYNAFILAVSSNYGTDYIKTSKVQLFLNMDIPLNGTWKGMTPLMYACQYNSSTAVIKLLMDNGARTSTTDAKGKRAFDYAKANKNLAHDDVYWALNSSN